jgi:hypothetical protein
MAGAATLRVRCPACDEWLTVVPRVVSVTRVPRSLSVTLDAPPVPHVCGDTPFAVGFSRSPSPKDGGPHEQSEVSP